MWQVWIRLPTLALKPRGNVTKSPKQGYQWPHKKDLCPPKIYMEILFYNFYNSNLRRQVNEIYFLIDYLIVVHLLFVPLCNNNLHLESPASKRIALQTWIEVQPKIFTWEIFDFSHNSIEQIEVVELIRSIVTFQTTPHRHVIMHSIIFQTSL